MSEEESLPVDPKGGEWGGADNGKRRRLIRWVLVAVALPALVASIWSLVLSFETQSQVDRVTQCAHMVAQVDNREDMRYLAQRAIESSNSKAVAQETRLERLVVAKADAQAVLDESSDCLDEEESERWKSTLEIVDYALHGLTTPSSASPSPNPS
ncbi:hypothetical protein [Streptomyces sp. NBC_01207]|uniref:hypothetical protein n=1 Tax=Streptomyces sp. NBC_01207 TaxID=2903772 RepID=UPI002E12D46F|nr:hypothetical protein OG457_21890 [Streptomyces sp. NBC_01207]